MIGEHTVGVWQRTALLIPGWVAVGMGVVAVYAGLRDASGPLLFAGATLEALGALLLIAAANWRTLVGAGVHVCDLPVLRKPMGKLVVCDECGSRWIGDRVVLDEGDEAVAVWTRF